MKKTEGGEVHTMPLDLKKNLNSFPKAKSAWENITPIARNEWMCWVLDAKKPETRNHRIERTIAELMEGKRRPCCWMGCIHRKDKSLNPSQKWILDKKSI